MSSSFSLSANEYKLQVFEITQRASPIRSVDSPFPPVEHTASPSSIKASTSHSKSSKILQAANKVARRSRSSPKLLQHPPEAQWIPPSESINDIITTPSVSPQAQQQAPQQRGSRASGFVSKFRLFKARRTSSTASGTERLLISNSSSTTSVNSVQSSKPGLEREGAFAIPYKHATLPQWVHRPWPKAVSPSDDCPFSTCHASNSALFQSHYWAAASDDRSGYRRTGIRRAYGQIRLRAGFAEPIRVLYNGRG
ncbi:hypothetical protein FRC20_001532 [Serendipita sp. 405]|nr:hypothetical protein FRC20_001532 [Serendipita sp. 405]